MGAETELPSAGLRGGSGEGEGDAPDSITDEGEEAVEAIDDDGEEVVIDDEGAAVPEAGGETDSAGKLGHSSFGPCCLIQSRAVVAACWELSGVKVGLEAQLEVGQLGVPQPVVNCRT